MEHYRPLSPLPFGGGRSSLVEVALELEPMEESVVLRWRREVLRLSFTTTYVRRCQWVIRTT